DRARGDHALPGRAAAGRRRHLRDRRRPAEDDPRSRRHAQSRGRAARRRRCKDREDWRLMAVSVVMAALEMAQDTGKLLSWRRKEGDQVTKGEVLFEIEPDKAVVEVEAPGDGILAAMSAAAGEVVPVGRTIAWLLRPGEMPPPGVPADGAQQRGRPR